MQSCCICSRPLLALRSLPQNACQCLLTGVQLTSSNPLSTCHQRFACARLSQSYLPKSRSDFSATFTTIAFDDSSLRWLEINT